MSDRSEKKLLYELNKNMWNDVPNKVIEALSIKSFENRLDKYWPQFKIKYNFDNCVDYQNQKPKSKLCRNKKKGCRYRSGNTD